MVSSIVPGTTSAGALGVDARYNRQQSANSQANDAPTGASDRVDMSGPAAWAAARESVSGGLSQLEAAMSAGRDAQNMLLAAQSVSSQADLDALLQNYNAGVAD